MKALTVQQPWATLIVIGEKASEFRSWAPPQAIIGQRIAIHAGKRLPAEFAAALRDEGEECEMPLGAIIGTAIVAGVGPADKDDPDAAHGDLAWRLTDPIGLAAPIPAKGRLGLWPLTPEQEGAVGGRAV